MRAPERPGTWGPRHTLCERPAPPHPVHGGGGRLREHRHHAAQAAGGLPSRWERGTEFGSDCPCARAAWGHSHRSLAAQLVAQDARSGLDGPWGCRSIKRRRRRPPPQRAPAAQPHLLAAGPLPPLSAVLIRCSGACSSRWLLPGCCRAGRPCPDHRRAPKWLQARHRAQWSRPSAGSPEASCLVSWERGPLARRRCRSSAMPPACLPACSTMQACLLLLDASTAHASQQALCVIAAISAAKEAGVRCGVSPLRTAGPTCCRCCPFCLLAQTWMGR